MNARLGRRGPLGLIGVVGAMAVLALAGCGTVPNNPLGPDSPSATQSATTAASADKTATPSAGSSTASSASASPTDTGSTTKATGPADCAYTQTGTASRPVKLPPTRDVPMKGTATAVLQMSSGTVKITLDRTDAPCTVNSFISLAQQHFYDNTTCPRMSVAQGLYMLQCGDPTGTLTGGPGYSFPDELSGNETYPAGTVAMANSGPNTNGSQFFLVYRDSQLDPAYTVFGHMDAAGIAAIDTIAKGGVDNSRGVGDGKPNTEAKIVSVTVS